MKHGLKVIKGSNWSLVRNEGFPTAKGGNFRVCHGETGLSPAQGGQSQS